MGNTLPIQASILHKRHFIVLDAPILKRALAVPWLAYHLVKGIVRSSCNIQQFISRPQYTE
ncbi:hypothetical protein D3C80_1819760 [compost metagenome]